MTAPEGASRPSPTSVGAARASLAVEIRGLAHELAIRELGSDDLDRVAAVVAELRSTVGRAPRRRPRGHALDAFGPVGADAGEPFGSFDSPLADRPVIGPTNPFAVESTSSIVGDEAVTTLTLGPGFEGAPGRAHGGIVAAIFDDVTGHVLRVVGTPAYTGSLTVRYLKPTPIDVPLEFRAWLERREGRRLHIEGACTAGGERVASCAAVFIAVDLERFAPAPMPD